MEAVHLLECLPGVKPRRTIPSSLAQWVNRFYLALAAGFKREIPGGIIIAFFVAGGFYLNQQLFSADLLLDLLAPHRPGAIFLGVYAIAPRSFSQHPPDPGGGFLLGARLGRCLFHHRGDRRILPALFPGPPSVSGGGQAKVPPERWEWLQDKVVRHGWKAVAFTRLVPVFPFNLLNYLFGLTPIPFRQYLGSTFVFMLPACIAFVAFGSSLGELVMRGNVKGVVIGLGVAVCAFLLTVALRRLYRKIGI